jgi:dTDP-4-amino-4,6-dideoxygalactose transaminase
MPTGKRPRSPGGNSATVASKWIPKWRLEDLALWGAPPAFGEPLHVGRPNIPDRRRFFDRLEDVLERRWLTNNGLYVQEFERRVARFLEVRHCVAVCNATVGLQAAARALGLAGEVILPSFTYVATAHALRWIGITPVFCDIRPDNYTLDPAQVEGLITPRTTGILGVHVYGNACAVTELEDLASRHKLALMFDAAHAFACSHQGRMIGGGGCAEVFSFHATKVVGTFEGGAVTTNDDEVAARLRRVISFGFDGEDEVVEIGTNARMSEASAAMGLAGMDSLGEWLADYRANYEIYRQELAGIPGVDLLLYGGAEKRNYQYVVIRVEEERAGLSRDALVEALRAENVLARRYFYPPCHVMEPYRSDHAGRSHMLPVSEHIASRVIALPTGTAVGPEEVRQVALLIRLCVDNGREISRRLAARRGEDLALAS